jgi:hypothetical protein
MTPPENSDLLERVFWLTAGVIMACLSAVWKVLRDTPPEASIPRRVLATAVIGGIVSGVFVMGGLLHIYEFEHPWAILVVSIPAGFGAPLILASAVNALVTIIKGASEALAKRNDK